MIFVDKYNGDADLLHQSGTFKEFILQDSEERYTSRSLKLIYDMYCRWLNATHGICLVIFHLSIPDDSNECSESTLDNLFHTVQDNVKHRNTSSDNSIGLISKTYRKNFSTNHEGYFLLPISDTEKHDTLKGDNKPILREVANIISRTFARRKVNLDTKSILHFSLKGKDMEHGIILSDACLDAHEQGFNILCEIAQIDIEPSLFRTRYGYNPALRSFHYEQDESLFTKMPKPKVFIESDSGLSNL